MSSINKSNYDLKQQLCQKKTHQCRVITIRTISNKIVSKTEILINNNMNLKTHFILILWLISNLNSFSQECGIFNHIDTNTEIGTILYEINNNHRYYSSEKLEELFSKLPEADSSSENSYFLIYNYLKGHYNFLAKDDKAKARKYFKRALEKANQIGEVFFQYQLNKFLAVSSTDYNEAQKYFKDAESNSIDLEMEDLHRDIMLTNLIAMYFSLGNNIDTNLSNTLISKIKQALSKIENDSNLFMNYHWNSYRLKSIDASIEKNLELKITKFKSALHHAYLYKKNKGIIKINQKYIAEAF